MSNAIIVREQTDVLEDDRVISSTQGKPGKFTTGNVPWMKLGRIVSSPKTAEEAIEASGLNFDVQLLPMEYTRPDGTRCLYSNRFVVEREDTGVPLGTVSGRYTPVQYRDAFSFMNTIHPEFVAAGPLNDGKQGFMVVKVPDIELNVLNGEDVHDLYAVLRTSHDRTRAIEIYVMPLRHICMNQLTLRSFGTNAPHRWSIVHTTNAFARLSEANDTIKNLSSYARQYEENASRLALVKLADTQARTILQSILPNYTKKRDEFSDRIVSMWHNDERVGYSGTGWGLVQAVSTYYDHERSGGSPQSRFLGALQGQTHQAINKTAAQILTRYSRSSSV